jgi:hypothetical protein
MMGCGQLAASKLSCRLMRSVASPISPSAVMMSCSACAMPTSVWVMSIGASDPTSIRIFVMRFRSWAIVSDSFFTARFS